MRSTRVPQFVRPAEAFVRAPVQFVARVATWRVATALLFRTPRERFDFPRDAYQLPRTFRFSVGARF